MKELSRQSFSEAGYAYLNNSSFILQRYEVTGTGVNKVCKPTGVYEMTDYGRKSLQDYLSQKRAAKRDLWLKNAWIPILVTIATNLLIVGIKALLPLIQELLRRIL